MADLPYWTPQKLFMWIGVVAILGAGYWYITWNGDRIERGEEPVYIGY